MDGSSFIKAKDKRESGSRSSKGSKKMDPNLPDRSYGDFYCTICDSHMNSEGMWEAHVIGKRHIKNVTKGDTDSKYEDLEGVESNIKYELRNVKDPIVGLSYIQEIRRREPNVPPMYNCFLCHASMPTVPLVIEHVISMKHRLNYMKENSSEEYQLLGATNLKKGHMEPLVHEAAIKMEQKYGRGTVKVKQEKPKAQVTTYKRNFEIDDNDLRRKLTKNAKIDKKPSVWKSVDTVKRTSMRSERSVSPRNFKDRRRLSYSDDEHSMDGYKRSSLKKKDASPKRDECRYSRPDARMSDSRGRPSYNLSPEYERVGSYSQEPVKNAVYPNWSPSDESYPQSQSHQSQEYLLPHEKAIDKPVSLSDPSMLKDFVQKVFALPTEIFLKIVLSKMENMELKGIDELSLLSKVINKAQIVLCNKLPPDVQAVLKQKMSQNSENNIQKTAIPAQPTVLTETNAPLSGLNFQSCGPNIPSGRLTADTSSQDAQSNIDFIRDILSSVKSVNSTDSVTQNAPTSQHVNSFQTQAVNSYQSQNLNPYQSQSANSYPSQSANSYQSQSANSYQSQSANSYQSQSADSYQSQNANSSYKNAQYPNPNMQYQSSNVSGSVQNYYSSTQPSTSSNIPGLTLTEQASPEPQTYNNYQQYSSASAVNSNYPYRY